MNPYYLGSEFWEEPNFWLQRSPLMHATNVRTPLLIQHGENDERVPTTQAYEYYSALKRIGKAPVDLIIYRNSSNALFL